MENSPKLEEAGSPSLDRSEVSRKIGSGVSDVAAAIAALRDEEVSYDQAIDLTGVSSEEHDVASRYNYAPTNLETVIREPERFIIPELLPVCRALWDKNIVTVQCSNDEEKKRGEFYVEVDALSEENNKLFDERADVCRRVFNPIREESSLILSGGSPEAIMAVVEMFQMQDIKEGFRTVDEFMASIREAASGSHVSGDGTVVLPILDEGKNAENITLEQALERTGKTDLYDAEEGRIYDTALCKDWHERYLEYLRNKKD